jgi:hypothetical protein
MDAKKINLDTYPTLNNVCLVPKDTLKELIDYYKDNEYIKQQLKEIKQGKRASRDIDDVISLLEKNGL